MAGLWGFAAGQQAATAQQQRQQMVNIATAEAPLRMQHEEIANRMSRLALQGQERFNNFLEQQQGKQSGGTQTTDQLGDQLRTMAEAALHSGNPQMSAKYMSTYDQYERNKATIATNQQKLAIQQAQLFDRLMAGVHDEASWRAANLAYMLQTGQPSRFAHVPYAVAKQNGLLDRIKAATITAVQKATINKDNAEANAARVRAATEPLRRDLVKRQIQESEARTRHLEKEGATLPTKQIGDNLKMLTDLVNKSYSVDPTRQAAVRAIMRPWAERMIELEKQNPDMSPVQAAQKVFQEAQSAHTFVGFDDFHGVVGQTPQAAIPYKPGAKLEDNKWYKNANGEVALYQNGKFYTEDEVKAARLQ